MSEEATKPTWNIGDRVFVVADNFGSEAEIIAYRESTGSPPSHWQVRTDTGDSFWAYDFEIQPLTDKEQA